MTDNEPAGGVIVEPQQKGFRPVRYPHAAADLSYRMPNGDLVLRGTDHITQVVYAAGSWRCYYPAATERELR